ncbi:pyridoxal phosphate-dependent aminotransferase [Collinsella tanakaei]|uniref:pyridoxal phosphate-dependent aminotransferase n=1 Tax=Collinsella tanakaei TaxID=626935 RepID=UPI00265A161E|nr:aminotransferase class I/II-fold pyridoxal phosphate-dependent enzyme [Collinsella tanakaei]
MSDAAGLPYGHGGDIWTQRERWGEAVLDLSANTNPLGMSPAAARAARDAVETSDRYPDPRCRRLAFAIAKQAGTDPGWVLCGNGAADLIWRLCLAEAPRRVLVAAPTFSEYAAAARAAGASVEEVALSEKRDFDLDCSFVDAVAPGIDMVFVCNPNNPTGRTVAPQVLDKLIDRCAAVGARLVVDECFLGFTASCGDTLDARVASSPHVVVLHAFTKLHGMAGLRLGYLLSSDEDLVRRVYLAGPPWPVSTPAQAAGVAALSDHEFVARTRELIDIERPRMMALLAAAGCRVVSGEANYVLFRLMRDAAPMADAADVLARAGVIVRDCSNYTGLDSSWVRACVRGRAESDALLDAVYRATGLAVEEGGRDDG